LVALELNPVAIVGHQRGEILAKPVGEKQRSTGRRQRLDDLMDETLGHHQRAIAHVDGQDQLIRFPFFDYTFGVCRAVWTACTKYAKLVNDLSAAEV
jgi:hypothetical protein